MSSKENNVIISPQRFRHDAVFGCGFVFCVSSPKLDLLINEDESTASRGIHRNRVTEEIG